MLVLDDYHVVGEPAIHRLVGLLVERLPPRARLVIATRADPPLPLARLRAQRRAARGAGRGPAVHVARGGRAPAIGCRRAGPGGGRGAHRADRGVGGSACGWPPSRSAAGRTSAELVRRFGATHRFVLDYVVEEVLAGLPPADPGLPPAHVDPRSPVRAALRRRARAGPTARSGSRSSSGPTCSSSRSTTSDAGTATTRCSRRSSALGSGILDAGADVAAARAGGGVARGAGRRRRGHRPRGPLGRSRAGLSGWSARPRCGTSMPASSSTVRRWLDALPKAAVRDDAQLSASYAWCLVLPGETVGVAARLADAERALAAGHARRPGSLPPRSAPSWPSSARASRTSRATSPPPSRRHASPATCCRPGCPREARPRCGATPRSCWRAAFLPAGDMDRAQPRPMKPSLPDLRAGGNMFAVGRAVADLAAIAHRARRPRGGRPDLRGGARADAAGVGRPDQRRGLGRAGAGARRARQGRARRGRGHPRPRARDPGRRRAGRPVGPVDPRAHRGAAGAPAGRARPRRSRRADRASSNRSPPASSRSCASSPSAGRTARSRASCS